MKSSYEISKRIKVKNMILGCCLIAYSVVVSYKMPTVLFDPVVHEVYDMNVEAALASCAALEHLLNAFGGIGVILIVEVIWSGLSKKDEGWGTGTDLFAGMLICALTLYFWVVKYGGWQLSFFDVDTDAFIGSVSLIEILVPILVIGLIDVGFAAGYLIKCKSKSAHRKEV